MFLKKRERKNFCKQGSAPTGAPQIKDKTQTPLESAGRHPGVQPGVQLRELPSSVRLSDSTGAGRCNTFSSVILAGSSPRLFGTTDGHEVPSGQASRPAGALGLVPTQSGHPLARPPQNIARGGGGCRRYHSDMVE